MFYGLFSFSAFILSWLLSRAMRPLALRWQYVDRPSRAPHRTLHVRAVPYGGGIAILASVGIVVLLISAMDAWPQPPTLHISHVVSLFVGSAILLVGGMIDDYRSLSARAQLVWSFIAVAVVVASGIGVASVRLPWGGIVTLGGASQLLTVVWLLVVMYSTKLFDGLDGLVTGIGAIGGFILFAVSLLPVLNQPQNALLALVFGSACAGFLFINWHPAKMFLGQGGSLLIGFVLGVLSIMTGTKVITTLLIIGIPLLDAVWVVVRRIVVEHRSPFAADRRHFHHRLLDAGFSHAQAVAAVLSVTAAFGILGFLLQTQEKLYALLLLGFAMLLSGIVLVRWENKRLTR